MVLLKVENYLFYPSVMNQTQSETDDFLFVDALSLREEKPIRRVKSTFILCQK